MEKTAEDGPAVTLRGEDAAARSARSVEDARKVAKK